MTSGNLPAKLIALYTTPDDPAAFDQKYFETHVPLAEKIPGLRRLEVSKSPKNLFGGASPYYMIAEMFFDNMTDLQAGMASEAGKLAGANIMSFAGKNITLLASEIGVTELVTA